MVVSDTPLLQEEALNCSREYIEEVSLLGYEEYKVNQEDIPVAKCWWWLKAPGMYSKKAMYVFFDGELYTEGYKVDSERAGVRPVFSLKPEFSRNLKPGDKVKIGKYEATVLSDGSCLLDESVCNHRFDTASNNWDKSELKGFIVSEEFLNMIFGYQK